MSWVFISKGRFNELAINEGKGEELES